MTNVPKTAVLAAGALCVLLAAGLAWALEADSSPRPRSDDAVVVETARDRYVAGDVVRVWIRNAGETALDGTPRLLVLTEDGAVHQSFTFAQFLVQLEPGEAVWVDWPTAPTPKPCVWGERAADGADTARGAYPCPMDELPGGAAPASDAGGAEGSIAPRCYPCPPWPRPTGTYVLVGLFGGHADARVVDVVHATR